MKVRIRRARRGDAADILRLIRALAQYEKLADEVVATPAQLRQTLFGRKPAAEILLAEQQGRAVGFALFFANYSTFLGKPGIYLEDLFVEPGMRGQGIGKALFTAVGRLAAERKCGRYEWSVLDWNRPAIKFYRSFGARPMSDWTVFRLSGAALASLATSPTRRKKAAGRSKRRR